MLNNVVPGFNIFYTLFHIFELFKVFISNLVSALNEQIQKLPFCSNKYLD